MALYDSSFPLSSFTTFVNQWRQREIKCRIDIAAYHILFSRTSTSYQRERKKALLATCGTNHRHSSIQRGSCYSFQEFKESLDLGTKGSMTLVFIGVILCDDPLERLQKMEYILPLLCTPRLIEVKMLIRIYHTRDQEFISIIEEFINKNVARGAYKIWVANRIIALGASRTLKEFLAVAGSIHISHDVDVFWTKFINQVSPRIARHFILKYKINWKNLGMIELKSSMVLRALIKNGFSEHVHPPKLMTIEAIKAMEEHWPTLNVTYSSSKSVIEYLAKRDVCFQAPILDRIITMNDYDAFEKWKDELDPQWGITYIDETYLDDHFTYVEMAQFAKKYLESRMSDMQKDE